MLSAARERALSLVEGHTTQMLHLDSLNKAKIKAWGFSPDSFAQMLFQLAYYRLHGKMGATYSSGGDVRTSPPLESCESFATRKFFHGRTECMGPHGKMGATYESCATHKFFYGRI
ncbi:hypothetical protein T484DRAFT_1845658 [Baffinella frigidus]|nr:hypothetical protein T484DRAFT_1845658 [Cryptophyta sp. CCMP2293]